MGSRQPYTPASGVALAAQFEGKVSLSFATLVAHTVFFQTRATAHVVPKARLFTTEETQLV